MAMDVYIYAADLLCAECGEKKRQELNEAALLETYGDVLPVAQDSDDLKVALGFDPENEREYDSGDYPKGPYEDGGGEADSPQHCGNCGVFLENPLTADGYRYVTEAIAGYIQDGTDGTGNLDILNQWAEFYREDLSNDQVYDFMCAVLDALSIRADRAAIAAMAALQSRESTAN